MVLIVLFIWVVMVVSIVGVVAGGLIMRDAPPVGVIPILCPFHPLYSGRKFSDASTNPRSLTVVGVRHPQPTGYHYPTPGGQIA
jgi:hypothetical protein